MRVYILNLKITLVPENIPYLFTGYLNVFCMSFRRPRLLISLRKCFLPTLLLMCACRHQYRPAIPATHPLSDYLFTVHLAGSLPGHCQSVLTNAVTDADAECVFVQSCTARKSISSETVCSCPRGGATEGLGAMPLHFIWLRGPLCIKCKLTSHRMLIWPQITPHARTLANETYSATAKCFFQQILDD